jgi:hypothetical protein
MKKIALIALLCLAGNAFSGELSNYNDIKKAVQQAKSIRIVVTYSACNFTGEQSGPVPDFGVGIFTPNEILIDNEGVINASMMHFTLKDPVVPNERVFQFLRYSIQSDNIIRLVSNSLDAQSYSSLSGSLSMECKLKTAAKVYVV